MNCVDLIARAMRRINVLPAGELPEGNELTDALETLKGLYQRHISEGSFGEIQEVIAAPGAFVAEEFTRVFRNNVDTSSVTLPDTVTEPCTGDVRPPLDRAVIVITDPFSWPSPTLTYIYDGDLRQWIAVETLEWDSIPPLASRDSNGFASLLARELSEEYGQQLGPVTAMSAERFENNIMHNWSREQPTVPRPENYY